MSSGNKPLSHLILTQIYESHLYNQHELTPLDSDGATHISKRVFILGTLPRTQNRAIMGY